MTKPKRTLLGVLRFSGSRRSALVVTASRHRDLVLIGVIDANDVVVTPRVQARLDSLLVDEGSDSEGRPAHRRSRVVGARGAGGVGRRRGIQRRRTARASRAPARCR